MVRTRVNIGSAESRYKAFQLAHDDRQKLLFPLLLGTLLAAWAISMVIVGPLGAHNAGVKLHGFHGLGPFFNASGINCQSDNEPRNGKYGTIQNPHFHRPFEKPKSI